MLYGAATMQLADDKPPFHFDGAVFDTAAKMVYDAGGFDVSQIADPKVRAVINETLRCISGGVNAALPVDVPDELRYALEENGYIFSGFKTFHAMREVGLSMLDTAGNIKPFDKFKADVKAINDKYNVSYLYAEYKHAIGAAQMAVKWNDIAKDGDRYLLQYRTAGDEKVREEHRVLDGITLPPSDPFWDSYYPPNGWGCRCTAVQVRREKYATSDPSVAMQLGDECTDDVKKRIFRYNAGKTLNMFPPKHPYYKVPAPAKKTLKQVIGQETEKARIKRFVSEMPSNLTTKEKEAIAQNCIDIEKALSIHKGKRMSVEDADRQSANPNYGKSYEYSVNCQTCAPAYALRLRGFNVWAKPNTKGSQSEYLARQRSFEAWLNPDGTPCTPTLTKDWMVARGYKRMTEARYREYFEETCRDEGVYILTIGWRGGGGHATVLQRLADGTLNYVEPQVYNAGKGALRPVDELCKEGGTIPYAKRGILRVDNKLFNSKFLSIFDK